MPMAEETPRRVANGSTKRSNPFVNETPSPAFRRGPNQFLSPARKIMAKYLDHDLSCDSINAVRAKLVEGEPLAMAKQADVSTHNFSLFFIDSSIKLGLWR